MFRSALTTGLLSVVGASVLAGQPERFDRMVIATNVVCRGQPDTASTAVASLRLGDRLKTTDQLSRAGASWYLVSEKVPAAPAVDPFGVRGTCWVHGPLTVEFSREGPEPALVATADHVLGRGEATFDDLVAVDNLFAWDRFATIAASSRRLQLRRLRVIDRAAARLQYRLGREPLTQAWLLSHRDVLVQSNPQSPGSPDDSGRS